MRRKANQVREQTVFDMSENVEYSVRLRSRNRKKYFGLWWWLEKVQPRKHGFDNVEKGIRLKPGVCILLQYNKTQDEYGVNETTNAECDVIIAPHSCTVVQSGPLRMIKKVGEQRHRKPKKVKSTSVRRNGSRTVACPKVFSYVLTWCSKRSNSGEWVVVSGWRAICGRHAFATSYYTLSRHLW